eukprot:16430265-Heterocapsa_arctica.AAC.1
MSSTGGMRRLGSALRGSRGMSSPASSAMKVAASGSGTIAAPGAPAAAAAGFAAAAWCLSRCAVRARAAGVSMHGP